MDRMLNPRGWPLAVKVPALVALFMLGVSIVLTNALLSRLKDLQQRQLATLSTSYLEGLAASLTLYVLRDDIWEVFDAIDRRTSLGGGFGRANIVVIDGRGLVLGSSNPRQTPVGGQHSSIADRFADGAMLQVDEELGRAYAQRILTYQGRTIGQIFADFDISHLLSERREVLGTLIVTNTIIAIMLAALGYWTIRRMLAPLGILSRHLNQGTSGLVHPILPSPAASSDSEFGRLFHHYNAMAEALNEREALAKQLAAEERLASLGRLASSVAHEINNPIGGMFNAIDTLKQHGERSSVRHQSLDLIDRGLRGIRDVVRTILATYRADREPRNLTAPDLNDMRLLLGPEAARRRICITWSNNVIGEIVLPAAPVRQILLNIGLNAVAASPDGGVVSVQIASEAQNLRMIVSDQGAGLPAHARLVLDGPHSKLLALEGGGGIGLWLIRRMVSDLGGEIAYQSSNKGTIIAVSIPVHHDVGVRDVA